MRDITLGDTIDFKFSTHEPDTGAPITLAGSPVISAYVGNSTTQITAGITLSVDFDGVAGLHNVRVVASSGNGFADASDVALIITTGTVDGVSAVGYKVAEFTIGRGAAHTRLGSPAGASVSADIAAIEAQTDDIGAAGAGLTAVPWNTAWDPHVGKVVSGTLSGTHSDTTADLGASAPTTNIVGQTLYFPTHQLARVVNSYNTGTGVATFDSIGVTLVNADPWYLFATAPSAISLDAAGIRAAVGLASANLDTQLGDLPTNAELATSQAAADDATLAAIAALNNLSSAEAQTAAAAALTAYDPPTRAELTSDTNSVLTAVGDVPTNAELATALGTADDAVLAAIAALNDLSAAEVNAEVDTAIADAALATAANLATVDTVVDAIQAKTDQLTFGATNALDANITHVIADPVQESGSTATNWGGAP